MSNFLSIAEWPVKSVSVPDVTYHLLSPANSQRVAFVISRNRVGQNFSVAFQKNQPQSLGEMWALNTTFDGFVFDAGVCPTSNIWVYHAVGSATTIFWMEG